MNVLADAPSVVKQPAPLSQSVRSGFAIAWKGLVFAWKFVFGMALCQSFIGGILIVGWTYRLMQRCVYRRWWQRSGGRAHGAGFRDFAAADKLTEPHRHWPNWWVEQNFFESVRRHPFRALAHSLWVNLRLGIQGILNTWVLTLPACVLMLFSWYDGWNNSFNKGYEQAPVGPLTGILGLLLFIVAMFYVPLAQARQAATGDWRAFYQFGLIRRLILRRWPACLGLAALYSLFSIPLLVFRIAPQFLPQMDKPSSEFLPAMTQAEITHRLNGYFFRVAMLLLPAYVILRVVAARIYATGLLSAIEQGVVPVEALAENERAVLGRLDLLQVRPSPRRHALIRFAGTMFDWAFWGAATIMMLLVWFSFTAQIYIAQFMNYLPGLGWLNQPLVQLPWFHFLPHFAK